MLIHTHIVAAHVGCLCAESVVRQRGAVGSLAGCDQILATIGHGVGELHVVVDSLVHLRYLVGMISVTVCRSRTYRFDAIGVVSGELRIVRGLDSFIDDSIDDSEGVEIELNAIHGAVGNLLVLFIEVIEELFSLERHI